MSTLTLKEHIALGYPVGRWVYALYLPEDVYERLADEALGPRSEDPNMYESILRCAHVRGMIQEICLPLWNNITVKLVSVNGKLRTAVAFKDNYTARSKELPSNEIGVRIRDGLGLGRQKPAWYPLW